MKPYKFTVKGDKTYFHYTIAQYREFIKYSYEGIAGELLVSRVKNSNQDINIFKVSGTLEKPHPIKRIKDLFTFHIPHFALFDGRLLSNEEICAPVINKPIFENYRIIHIDKS